MKPSKMLKKERYVFPCKPKRQKPTVEKKTCAMRAKRYGKKYPRYVLIFSKDGLLSRILWLSLFHSLIRGDRLFFENCASRAVVLTK
jgi:hypothetical protein